MNVIEAIKTRRTIGKVKQDPISKDVIEELLEAARWAPNYHLTEPWKFFVLTGEGRRPLGRVLGEIAMEKLEDPTSDEGKKMVMKKSEKPFRAPVVIAVALTPPEHPKSIWIEEVAAASAAVQNLLLAAHARGLGAIWRTGKPTYHPKMKELFGLKEKDEMLGFIYLGYPDMKPKEGRRTLIEEKTVWMSEDISYLG
ncbi:nitroreductase [Mechercharimyces sp. CAU 1602]|uniref:nitroreductase family protein n=1 Tax=Mechercharimyces sp. CAU 1602 TaxID=2973933 RepID=UPI002161C0A5|nr:nitroreductase [Mechercharimyces sp. CAU 1602]MCS1351585.1 nitroreductase [Mechercharimyces sp. CAU 1602]